MASVRGIGNERAPIGAHGRVVGVIRVVVVMPVGMIVTMVMTMMVMRGGLVRTRMRVERMLQQVHALVPRTQQDQEREPQRSEPSTQALMIPASRLR